MSPRKTILKELARAHERSGGNAHTRPDAIPGFGARPDKYQEAVNQLLRDRLIEGRRDEEGRMALAVNDHRLRDVLRAIRPFWARPAVWAVVVLVVAAVSVGFVI